MHRRSTLLRSILANIVSVLISVSANNPKLYWVVCSIRSVLLSFVSAFSMVINSTMRGFVTNQLLLCVLPQKCVTLVCFWFQHGGKCCFCFLCSAHTIKLGIISSSQLCYFGFVAGCNMVSHVVFFFHLVICNYSKLHCIDFWLSQKCVTLVFFQFNMVLSSSFLFMEHLLASYRTVARLWRKCIDVTESHRLQHGVDMYIAMDGRSCIATGSDAHLTLSPLVFLFTYARFCKQSIVVLFCLQPQNGISFHICAVL